MGTLPEWVEVGGRFWDIRADFRTSIRFEMYMTDSTISPTEQARYALELFYPIVPNDSIEAVRRIIEFYTMNRGQRQRRRRSERGAEDGGSVKKVYDYEYDAPLIYAAFMQQYGINLQCADLHWWEFKALFDALTKDTLFVQVMGYRSVSITDDMSDSQKAFYRDMKKMYALPLEQAEEERQRAIEEALMNGSSLEGLL